MPQCSFNRPAAMMQATPVQNMFLIEYQPKAPDAYVKVYLYGLMQCCNQPWPRIPWRRPWAWTPRL